MNRLRLSNSWTTPAGDLKIQCLAFEFVGNLPASGDACAAGVPFSRFAVCPLMLRLYRLCSVHSFCFPRCLRLRWMLLHSLEQVTVLSDGGQGKLFPQTMQVL